MAYLQSKKAQNRRNNGSRRQTYEKISTLYKVLLGIVGYTVFFHILEFTLCVADENICRQIRFDDFPFFVLMTSSFMMIGFCYIAIRYVIRHWAALFATPYHWLGFACLFAFSAIHNLPPTFDNLYTNAFWALSALINTSIFYWIIWQSMSIIRNFYTKRLKAHDKI